MKSKKGISQIVAYVLLISLAVGLGVFVTVWYKGVAKEQVETVLTPIAGGSECEQVNVNVAFNYTECKLKLYNSGMLKIVKFEIYEPGGDPWIIESELMPKQWHIESLTNPLDVIEVFPVIEVNKQLFKCQKNKVFKAQENFNC